MALVSALVVAAAVYTALWTPGDLGLSARPTATGPVVITWVAPNGPAWEAGIRPGDHVVSALMRGGTAADVVVRSTRSHRVVHARLPVVRPLDVVVAGLGLSLLLLGAVVYMKSADPAAGGAFWRMSLLAGITMGVVPAGFHGAPWALVLTFVALYLFGPALLDLTLSFPADTATSWGRGLRQRSLLWLPVLVVLLLYPLCWWQPAQLFPPVQATATLLLASYILAACAHMVLVARRDPSAQQHTQVQLVALGLVFGLLPFVALTLLPLIIAGHALVAGEVTILALVLLPLTVGVAIVRLEFLGITSLIRRRTLHMLLGGTVMVSLASGAGLLAAVAQQMWNWSGPLVAVATSALTALVFTPLQRWLMRRGDHLLLRDSYEMESTLLQLSVDLSTAEPQELGPLVVTRLSMVLDLGFVLLLTREGSWFHCHPRSAVPSALQDALLCHAQALLEHPAQTAMVIERVPHLPVLFLPLYDSQDMVAMLCLGPKRSGDRYTGQDQVLLGALGRHLSILFANHRLRTQRDAQIATLRDLVAERTALSERVRSTAEGERRRLAGVLHDDAIQVGGEVVRSLRDLLALPHLPSQVRASLAALVHLSNDLVARLREIAAELHPPPLDTAGLLPALQALLHAAEQRTGCTCPLDADPHLLQRRLPCEQEQALYMIARETVCNALEHAQASTINLTLRWEGADLCLTVRDDGRGFMLQPVSAFLRDGHLGLALLHERVNELRGTLAIITAPGCGATVEVRVPAPDPAGEEQEV